MMNSGFGDLADRGVDLYPADLREEIDPLNTRIYPRLNNGVYRAGFATTQVAYEEAFAQVFAMLDELEARLGDGRNFLLGDRFTEADVRLFVTLVRSMWPTTASSSATCGGSRTIPASAPTRRASWRSPASPRQSTSTTSSAAISIKALNPTGIVPSGPEVPAALAA